MNNLEREIFDSRKMLDLEDNWDDEGAVMISQRAWLKAVRLVRIAYARMGVGVPTIGPCCDGSVDLFYKCPTGKLLVNVRHDGTIGSYYGSTLSWTPEDEGLGKP